MISQIKTLLTNEGSFNLVELAQDLDDPVNDFTNDVPAAIVYQADTKFSDSTADNFVIQAADKQIVVMLICAANNVETLENTILTTLLGFQNDATYSGLEAVKAENYKITGHYYARRLIFTTRTHVREST